MERGAQTLDLDCGIALRRIVSWLEDELALPVRGGKWVFAAGGGECLVNANALPSRDFGAMALQRTRLVATGDECALERFEHLFTLRFVSAGG